MTARPKKKLTVAVLIARRNALAQELARVDAEIVRAEHVIDYLAVQKYASATAPRLSYGKGEATKVSR